MNFFEGEKVILSKTMGTIEFIAELRRLYPKLKIEPRGANCSGFPYNFKGKNASQYGKHLYCIQMEFESVGEDGTMIVEYHDGYVYFVPKVYVEKENLKREEESKKK